VGGWGRVAGARARVVLVTAVMVTAVAGASPGAAASVAGRRPPVGDALAARGAMSLGQAPAALRAAVRRTLGTPAKGARVLPGTRMSPADAAPGDQVGWSVAVAGSTAVVGADGTGSSAGAAYVFVLASGSWSEQAELTAAGGAAGDQFGYSVAIAGSTVVVGAPARNSDTGAAYVFTGSGGTWTEQPVLTAAGGTAGDYFGGSVAISGSTALVGATEGASGGAGAVYVFTRSGSAWSQAAQLSAAGGASGDLFGASVAISGSTAVVGAYANNSDTGAAYVFAGSGGTWSQEAELTASDGVASDLFGCSVAISGSTIVIGAYAHGSDAGAAYVFTGTGNTWSQQAELTAEDGAAGNDFGASVSVAGSTAVIGAPGFTNSSAGSAYQFVRSGTSWSQQSELTEPGAVAGNRFGNSVAIAGSTAVLGAPDTSSSTGAAYVFGLPKQQAELIASDGSGIRAGWSVAVSGSTAVVGAPAYSTATGAAYVFVRSSAGTWSQQYRLTASDGSADSFFGASVAISGSTVVVGAFGATGVGAAYVFVQSGSTWSQQRKLTDPVAQDAFGVSVAISGSTVVVGAPNDNSKVGAAYVFVRSGTSWTRQAKLLALNGAAGDHFGGSVAVDGSTVVVGAASTNSSAGAAYVFVRSGTSWSQQVGLTGPKADDCFGGSVAISGTTAIVGAECVQTNGAGVVINTGAAYVYARSGTAWTKQAELTSSGSPSLAFGFSVAISGSTAMVGAYASQMVTGAAYVFVRSGGTWSQQAELTGAATRSDFGYSVAMSGSTAVAGAWSANTLGGAVYVDALAAPASAMSTLRVKDTSATSLKLSTATVTLGHESTEHLSVQVRSPHPGAVTGKVTITAQPAKGKPAKVCVISLKSGKGSCTLKASALQPGGYKLTAAYGGSQAILASASTTKSLTVRK
jgi:hypothetical protein